MISARFLAETWGYFRNSSIISTWVMSILRQQYRLIPSSSSTLMGLSPALTLRLNVSHLSAISLPQVKHRTGMIISFLPVRFLFSSSCAWSAELLGFGYSLISGQHYPVEGDEVLS